MGKPGKIGNKEKGCLVGKPGLPKDWQKGKKSKH